MSQMCQLIERDGELWVDARELHGALGVGSDFSNWLKRRFKETESIEEQDFLLAKFSEQKTGRGGHNTTEYLLSLDMAKHFSLLERNPAGKSFRQYFIEAEKRFRVLSRGLSAEDRARLEQTERNQKTIALAYTSLKDRIDAQQAGIDAQQAGIDAQRVEFQGKLELLSSRLNILAEDRKAFYTIVDYGIIRRVNIFGEQAKMLGKRASKRCRDLGIDLSKLPKFPHVKYGQVNSYPEYVLREVFDAYSEGL